MATQISTKGPILDTSSQKGPIRSQDMLWPQTCSGLLDNYSADQKYSYQAVSLYFRLSQKENYIPTHTA